MGGGTGDCHAAFDVLEVGNIIRYKEPDSESFVFDVIFSIHRDVGVIYLTRGGVRRVYIHKSDFHGLQVTDVSSAYATGEINRLNRALASLEKEISLLKEEVKSVVET